MCAYLFVCFHLESDYRKICIFLGFQGRALIRLSSATGCIISRRPTGFYIVNTFNLRICIEYIACAIK